MSAAMRSTLQTVPESLEVTRGSPADNGPPQAQPQQPAKAPVKLSESQPKPRSTFNYHPPTTNKVSQLLLGLW